MLHTILGSWGIISVQASRVLSQPVGPSMAKQCGGCDSSASAPSRLPLLPAQADSPWSIKQP